jgi:sucrose 6(F)-phosphate phosphorylase
MAVKNQVQLITYPDSLGGDLGQLAHVLTRYFPAAFEGGIHILPPFPSSGDRGFAPLTYSEIEPKLGSWEDIQQIGMHSPVLLDLIVNHISAQSKYFQDYLLHGSSSVFADLFIPIEKHWPNKSPSDQDIQKIFLRRPSPFSGYSIRGTGELKTLWTTFGKTTPSEQVDIDVNSPIAQRLLAECLTSFAGNHVKIVRLDAVGYVTKEVGTSCFFVEPQIFQFLDWLRGIADSLDITLLPEVHAELRTQLQLSAKGYWIYDFVLPYMILEAWILKNAKRLKDYLASRPHRQFTMLDCHDGIPVKPDVNGLYETASARRVVQTCLQRGGNLSRVFSPVFKDADGFDVHQIRGTYYSMLGCDDVAYLAARALQFFVPGVPQVYYVGLLAGANDEAASAIADGRDINRHNYSLTEIADAVERPVVRNLLRLISIRNSHPAFNGTFNMEPCSNNELALRWERGAAYARLHIDLQANGFEIRYRESESSKEVELSFV